MSNKLTDFKSMQGELQGALDILDDYQVNERHMRTADGATGLVISEADSLLARCEQVVKQHHNSSKAKMRVIHHFACSGGTLISKCIAALPNVYVLSEVHPDTKLHMWHDRPQYIPSDITTLSRYAKIPEPDKLSRNIFLQNICSVSDHLERQGGTLVLRDHSHADYCVGNDFQLKSSVVCVLEKKYDCLRVVTIRDPVDSYLSLINNNWEHYNPKGFNEYCKRYLAFTSEYSKKQIIKYEDFVEKPEKVLKKIAKRLDLPFSESFIDWFEIVEMTGDSGRSGSRIERREQRPLTKYEYDEICSCKAYKEIIRKFGYPLPRQQE